MNLAQYIFEALQEKGVARVPDFGVFRIQKKSAVLEEKESKLLPPAFTIVFSQEIVKDHDFAKEISAKTSKHWMDVTSEIKEQVSQWNNELQFNKNLSIPELGKFALNENHITFTSQKEITKNPQFYGLEEINLKEIKSTKLNHHPTAYRFNNALLWSFLLVVPVLGIIVLAILKQELLFGKKSFENLSVKTSTQRIEKDTVHEKQQSKIADSVKIDSLQKDSLARNQGIIKNQANASKKTYYKNKTTWKKAKRRASP